MPARPTKTVGKPKKMTKGTNDFRELRLHVAAQSLLSMAAGGANT